jgi:acyl-CoA thioesterase
MTQDSGEEPIDFDTMVTPAALGGGRSSVALPDGWQQGRGAFGGLVLAVMVRAAEAAASDAERPLRSLSAQIVGPVQPGEVEIATEVLRAGSAVTSVAARLVQAGQIQAHAVAVFGRARATYAARPIVPAPEPPPWRGRASIPLSSPMLPVFARHLEYWPTGQLPFSEPHRGSPGRSANKLSDGASLGGVGPDAVQETAGWVRMRRPGRARDAAYVVALIDSYWPGFLAAATGPRPSATLTFSLETLADLAGLDPDAPLFYRARVLGGRDGYAIEARELWGEDGRLVALNQQIFVVIK